MSDEQPAAYSRVRIATIGGCPETLFHLEAAAIREGLEPVAAALASGDVGREDSAEKDSAEEDSAEEDSAAAGDGEEEKPLREAAVPGHRTPAADRPQPATELIPGCPICGSDELLERGDIDVVFVGGPVENRIGIARNVLRAGKHAVVGPSAAFSLQDLELLSDEMESTGRCCLIWRRFEADTDFRQARQVVRSGEAGRIHAVRFLEHEMAAALLPDSAKSSSRERMNAQTLKELAAQRLWQLVCMLEDRVLDDSMPGDSMMVKDQQNPLSSPSVIFSEQPVTFGTGSHGRGNAPGVSTSVCVVMEIEGGLTAVLDIGRSFPVSLTTGWIVQGSQGGYHRRRQHITVADGELYDVAVEIPDFDLYHWMADLIRSWPDESVRQEARHRLLREQKLASLLRELFGKPC